MNRPTSGVQVDSSVALKVTTVGEALTWHSTLGVALIKGLGVSEPKRTIRTLSCPYSGDWWSKLVTAGLRRTAWKRHDLGPIADARPAGDPGPMDAAMHAHWVEGGSKWLGLLPDGLSAVNTCPH